MFHERHFLGRHNIYSSKHPKWKMIKKKERKKERNKEKQTNPNQTGLINKLYQIYLHDNDLSDESTRDAQ